MKRSARTRGALAFILVGLGVLSCQLLLDVDEPEGQPRPKPVADATADIVTTDPCTHKVPPKAPEVPDDPVKNSYWFATSAIQLPLRTDEAGVHPAYDLDDSCTCMPDKYDGEAPCRTRVRSGMVCDFEGGVDDSFGRVALDYTTAVPNYDPTQTVNNQFDEGKRSLLMYLGEYNDKPDDPLVYVGFAGSGGLYTNEGCSGEARPIEASPFFPPVDAPSTTWFRPAWDGCDRWSPNKASTNGVYPNRVPATTVAGWVTNNVLTIPISRVSLEFFAKTTYAGNGIFTAQIVPTGDPSPNNKYRLEGILAGRMTFQELIRVVGRTPVNRPGADAGRAPLCDTPFWELVGPTLCEALDTMELERLEHTREDGGELVACDAATAALGFTGRQIQVADTEYNNDTENSGCEDASVVCR